MLASFVMFAAVAADLPDKPSLGNHIAGVVMLWVGATAIVAGVSAVNLGTRQDIIRENSTTPANERPVPTRWQAQRWAKITFAVVVVIAAAITFLVVRGYDNAHQNYQAQARIESAASVRTPPEALGVLASDSDTDVRVAAVANPRTPPDALAALASDSDTDVRVAVAANPRTPPDALAALGSDSVVLVRSCVGANHNSPPEVLETLAGDSEAAVRGRGDPQPVDP